MEEKVLCEGHFSGNIGALFANLIGLLICGGVIGYGASLSGNGDTTGALFIVMGCVGIVFNLIGCMKAGSSRKQDLTVTTLRVYGTSVKEHIDVTIDQIQYARIDNKGLVIATHKGSVIFPKCDNEQEICNTIQNLLTEQKIGNTQESANCESIPTPNDLLQYKNLLDNGLLTQEEFDKIKQRILNL